QQFALALGQIDRRLQHHPAQQITRLTAADRHHALATQAEQFAGLGPLRNLQLYPTIQRGHFQLATQSRVGKTDRHLTVQVLAVTLEDLVLAYRHHHVQVAGGTAIDAGLPFTGQADAIATVHARRHLHRQGLVFLYPPLTMAIATGIGNHLPRAMTTRAGLLHGEETLLHAHLAMAATGGTGRRAGALLRTAAITGLAADQSRHLDGDGGPAYRLLQLQLQGIAQVAAALDRGASAAAATEDVAEHVAEDIREVATAEAACAGAHVRVDTGMAILVVGRPLVGVGEDLVGLVGLLEFLLGLLVIRVAVRVILHCQSAVGLLQLGFTGAALYAQHLIIVTLGHTFCSFGKSYGTNGNAGMTPALPCRTVSGPGSCQARSPKDYLLLSLTSSNSASTKSSASALLSPALAWASPWAACSSYIFCTTGAEASDSALILASISALSSPLTASSRSASAFSIAAFCSSVALSPASDRVLRVACTS